MKDFSAWPGIRSVHPQIVYNLLSLFTLLTVFYVVTPFSEERNPNGNKFLTISFLDLLGDSISPYWATYCSPFCDMIVSFVIFGTIIKNEKEYFILFTFPFILSLQYSFVKSFHSFSVCGGSWTHSMHFLY